ncbi:MAG TPA: hypothetical protein HPP87_04665 [Planctomycetes bacterium]|nr:hypothetical protein [Planctomycetota bacterium]
MAEVTKTKTETQVEFEDKNLTASVKCWAAFDAWCANRGYRTRNEGFRAAVEKLTNFNDGSQDKNPEKTG